MFYTDEGIVSGANADEFVQLHLDGCGVSILRILNEENHEERDNGGAGIDDELPGVRIVENGACNCPNNYHPCCNHERGSPPGSNCGSVRNVPK